MKIRYKITIYFSFATLLLTGIAFILIYFLFSENREEEFQMRQKEKISTSLKLLAQIEKTDKALISEIDILTIHDLYDEKLLLFDSDKKLIYSSVDDMPVSFSKNILSQLTPQNKWIETKDGLYDVVGTYIESDGNTFYGISKAYDTTGYSKMRYLKYILIATFLTLSGIVVVVSFFLSGKITQQLTMVTQKINQYDFEAQYEPIETAKSDNEVVILASQFNKLMNRINEVYSFQRNVIHHISHQLKTPIAVLISELERIKQSTENEQLKFDLNKQISKTKSLAEIINTLLQISKIEAGQSFEKTALRIDELIFDCISELNTLYPDFVLEVNYTPAGPDAELLVIDGNEMLMKQAFQNLLNNCIAYSDNQKAEIKIDVSQPEKLKISVSNNGKTISENEQHNLFTHFFRGENSRNKIGFGLGLVLTKNIVELHKGTVCYSNFGENVNVFMLTFNS